METETNIWLARIRSVGTLGALLAFSVLSQVGLFTLPLAAALIWLLIRYSTNRRDAVGLVAGVASLLFYVGAAHVGEARCSPSAPLGLPAEGKESVSCTDFVSTPWLLAGVLLLVLALGVFARGPRHRNAVGPRA